MKTECPSSPKAIDFVCDELAPEVALDFAIHLKKCEVCRAAVDDQRALRTKLLSLPVPRPARSPGEIAAAAVRSQRATSPRGLRASWWAAAAAVVLCAGAVWRMNRGDSRHMTENPANALSVSSHESLDRAVHWLESQQEADGSWNVEKWGARPEFQVALTALSSIAILNSTEVPQSSFRAIEWLANQQNKDGMFGPKGVGRPFNQSLATLALLHAAGNAPSGALQAPIDAGLKAILRSQISDGGWGHYGSAASNSAVTAWHVQALEIAADQGWSEVNEALERGKTFLHRAGDASTTSAGAGFGKTGRIDMCAAYFSAMRLSERNDAGSRDRLEELRRSLIGLQTASGEDSGSWPPDDTRGHVGGRLFSTSLAALTLNDSP